MIKMPPVRQDYYAFDGGLDLTTPAISLNPGNVIDAQNYEPAIGGGYRRIDGYERFDGRSSPSAAAYYVASVTLSATVNVGNTITGASSGATAIVLANNTTYLICTASTGTFTANESIKVSSVTVGTIQSFNYQSTTDPSAHADNLLLAANYQRALIQAVPGSGAIRGVWVFNDVTYCWRDNVGATASVMYKSTGSGWSAISLGNEIQFSQRQATCTMTIAAPCVVTLVKHGATAGTPVVFTTTGALPTGLTAGTTYYVLAPAADTFNVAATVGGAPITTFGTQSGVHTATITGSAIVAGNTITGVTSGATAVVSNVLLRTGTFTAQPVGTLIINTITGTFQNGEALTVGGVLAVQAASANTAITRAAGGRVECFNYNFTGSLNTQKMYGCDGVNPAFEFDGTTYVPIRTGMASETPLHVIAHKGFLFLSFLASVQYSALGNPYGWSVVIGSGEFDCSRSVTGFLPQGGNVNGSSLAIFTAEKTFVLYGSSNADFKLVTSVADVGYFGYTCQQVSNDAFGLSNRGIQALVTTLNYGDFDYSSVSHKIQPLITKKRGLEIASNTLRTKNQYRVYFSDGTALAVGLTGDKINGILPLNYGKAVRCIVSATLTNGTEVTYFGSDDGYVYQDNVGTSQDGSAIEAWIRLPFNSDKSPRVRKRFRRAVFEMSVESFAKVNISYDFGYGNPDVNPSAPSSDVSFIGGGGYWDQFTWDQFTWDSQFVSNPSISIEGTEKNISLLFYSNRAQDSSHILQGVTLISSPRILQR